MKRVKKIARYTETVLLITFKHYWLTLTAGIALQYIATAAAYLERGYSAAGSEILVFPIVLLIGYWITPKLEITISSKGVTHKIVNRGRRKKYTVIKQRAQKAA